MKIRPLVFVLLLLAGMVRATPPPVAGTWGPLPPEVTREVTEFFRQLSAALAGQHIAPVMALYAVDATEAVQIGANSRMAVPNIQERRKADMKRLAESGTSPEAVDPANLQYQPGATPNEFRIRRLVFKAASAAGKGSPTSEVFYLFRRAGPGLLISSTLTRPVDSPRPAPVAAASGHRRTLVGPDGLPMEVELINGLRLREAVVVQWQTDGVLIKHVGGIDPIKFERIIPEQRTLFEAQLSDRLRAQSIAYYSGAAAARHQEKEREMNENSARAQEEAREERREQLEEEVSKHHLVVGMTMDQVRRSWGYPTTSNPVQSSDGNSVLWIYERKGIDEHGNVCNAGVGLQGDFVMELYNVKNR